MYKPDYTYLRFMKLRNAWAKRNIKPAQAKRIVGEVISELHAEERGIATEQVYQLALKMMKVLEGGLV